MDVGWDYSHIQFFLHFSNDGFQGCFIAFGNSSKEAPAQCFARRTAVAELQKNFPFYISKYND